MSNDKCYSLDGENFRFDNIGDLFDELVSDGQFLAGTVYYEMDCERVSASAFMDSDYVLENAECRAYDELGEYAEDMFSASAEAVAELDAFLTAWANKHVTGTWWRCIGEMREHKVTAEDVEQPK